ncbi:MAG: glycosyltransferase family 39 protein [Anaerolineae bacterium]|nr:glycosyltransferase family 39 protein [Anaerolineae bacterium]
MSSGQSNFKVQKQATWIDRWWPICLILILFIGGILRLGSLSMIEFRHDSAYWALDAYRILRGGYIPLVGQQVGSVNVELYNGPIMSYIATLVFALAGYQPAFVAMLIASCNVVGILTTFLLGKQLYSRSVGLVAATLVSLAPWLVLYGRMLWPQALYPCLIPLSLWALLLALEKDKVIWYLFCGVLLGIGLQLHLSMMAVIGTGILFVLIYSHRKWSVLLIASGVAIGYAPILLHDVSHGFTNIEGLAHLPTLHAVDEPRIFHYAKTLWNFANVLSGQALWVSKLSEFPYLPAFIDWGQGILFSALFLLALAIIATENSRGKPFRQAIKLPYQDAMLLLFVILPTAYLFLSRSLIQRHYFLFFYPVPFLIIARGIELWQGRLTQRKSPRGLAFVAPLALSMACMLNLVTVAYGHDFLLKSGGEGQYGTVLADKQGAVDFILAHSSGNYAVNIEDVQETLPYVFLFQVRDDIMVEGREDSAVSIWIASAERQSHQYRIVELSYHDLSIADGEKVLYKSGGVVVVGPGEVHR